MIDKQIIEDFLHFLNTCKGYIVTDTGADQRIIEKELRQKLVKKRKEQERRRKAPSYKGFRFKNWLVYPLGVISVEMDLAHAKKYNALKWSDEKALEIINKYFIKICDYDEETKELSFSTEWRNPWKAHACKKDKLWCQKFNFELSQFVKNIYTIPGFTKFVDDDWIIFTKL